MSKNPKSVHSRTGLQKLLVAIIALVIIGIIVKLFIYEPFRKRIIYSVAEKFIQAEIASDSELEENIHAQEIMDSMNEEDRDVLEQIISENISPDAISDVSSYLASGDLEGLKNYAKNTLSDRDLEKIRDLYTKYKNQILQNIEPKQT